MRLPCGQCLIVDILDMSLGSRMSPYLLSKDLTMATRDMHDGLDEVIVSELSIDHGCVGLS